MMAGAFLLVIVLAAFAIDINQAQNGQRRLQQAADLSALSASVWLPDQTDATNTATAIAKANGATSLTVTYPNPGEVRVAMQTASKYYFGSAFGIPSKVVGAGGTATSRGGRIVPIGVGDIALTPGKQYTYTWLNLSGGTLGTTDWAAMSIGGSGNANFTNRLENSFPGDYPKGAGKATETVDSINAALTGIVDDPVSKNAIFQQASQSPWFDTGSNYSYPNYPEGDPRIVMTARVIQPAEGKAPVTINRYGSMYLRDYQVVMGKGKGKAPSGQLTFVWLGDFSSISGTPNRGWFASKGLTKLTR
jgi:Flp pilus assembly protein TadG